MKIIDNTPYKKIVRKYLDEEGFKNDIFEIENDLDKNYLKNIYEISGRNKDLRKMIGTKIDFNNILWIYRMKKNFNFSDDIIKNDIIDIFYGLNKSEIYLLIDSDDFNIVDLVLSKSPYLKICSSDINEMKSKMNKYLNELYLKNFKSNLLSINCLYSYLNLVELENKKIIGIIESVRYGIE